MDMTSLSSNPSIFLSRTWSDKPFAGKLASDIQTDGAKVRIDEAEIKLGDSLIEKIRPGIDTVDYPAVVLSPKSVESEWTKRKADIAMNQEIRGQTVKVLPLHCKPCTLPVFPVGKSYADFTDTGAYQRSFALILDRLGISIAGTAAAI